LRIQVSQGSAATDLRWGSRFNTTSSVVNRIIQQWKNLHPLTSGVCDSKHACIWEATFWTHAVNLSLHWHTNNQITFLVDIYWN